MSEAELKLLELGLEVAKLRGEYDAQIREIEYLRAELRKNQALSVVSPSTKNTDNEIILAYLKQIRELYDTIDFLCKKLDIAREIIDTIKQTDAKAI